MFRGMILLVIYLILGLLFNKWSASSIDRWIEESMRIGRPLNRINLTVAIVNILFITLWPVFSIIMLILLLFNGVDEY